MILPERITSLVLLLRPLAQDGISGCYAGYLRRKMLLISYADGVLSEQIE